jgi:hypothetical protein
MSPLNLSVSALLFNLAPVPLGCSIRGADICIWPSEKHSVNGLVRHVVMEREPQRDADNLFTW